MALTPQQLKENAEARQQEAFKVRVRKIIEEIDQSLEKNAALFGHDSDTASACVNFDIPDDEARAIEKEYLTAGWKYASVSRADTGDFCIITLGRTTESPFMAKLSGK